LSRGAIEQMVVIALQFNTSSRMYNDFRPQIPHLLPSWPMDQSSHGVIPKLVVSTLQSRIG